MNIANRKIALKSPLPTAVKDSLEVFVIYSEERERERKKNRFSSAGLLYIAFGHKCLKAFADKILMPFRISIFENFPNGF